MAQAPAITQPSVLNVPSPGQIQQQAVNMVRSEYRPVIRSIQQQEKLATGLADKRSADNEAYQNWLGAQTNALENQRTQQNTEMTGLLNGIQSAQSNLYGGDMSNALVNQANSRMGNVSSNANSNTIGTAAANGGASYTQGMEQSGRGLVDAATQMAGNTALDGNNLLAATSNNDTGVLDNNTKQNRADLQDTLSKLRDALSLDEQKQVGDTNTLYQNLSDKATALAENNRNFDVASSLSGVRTKDYLNAIADRNAALGNSTRKTNAGIQNTLSTIESRQVANWVKQQELKVKQGALTNNTNRTDAYVNYENQRANGLKGGTGGLTPSERNTARRRINMFAGQANSLLNSAYLSVPGIGHPVAVSSSPQLARYLWQNGGTYYVHNTATNKYEARTAQGHSPSNVEAWAGFQTSSGGKGLTQNNVNELNQIGYGTLGYGLAPGTNATTTKVATKKSASKSGKAKP